MFNVEYSVTVTETKTSETAAIFSSDATYESSVCTFLHIDAFKEQRRSNVTFHNGQTYTEQIPTGPSYTFFLEVQKYSKKRLVGDTSISCANIC